MDTLRTEASSWETLDWNVDRCLHQAGPVGCPSALPLTPMKLRQLVPSLCLTWHIRDSGMEGDDSTPSGGYFEDQVPNQCDRGDYFIKV